MEIYSLSDHIGLMNTASVASISQGPANILLKITWLVLLSPIKSNQVDLYSNITNNMGFTGSQHHWFLTQQTQGHKENFFKKILVDPLGIWGG